jgi:histidine phosphotransferase ChpT
MADGLAPAPTGAPGGTRRDAAAALALAQSVCTRLCHDLGGPVGALSGALEMLDGGDAAAEVARDAARSIDRRLRFWRAALGGPSGALDAAALAQLGEGLTLGRRATLDLTGLVPEFLIEATEAQPLLLAMLVGIESLPRGGVLRVAGSPAAGLVVQPDGPGAAWPAGLHGMLAGGRPALSPRAIALPLLEATAAEAGMRLRLVPATDPPGLALRLDRG